MLSDCENTVWMSSGQYCSIIKAVYLENNYVELKLWSHTGRKQKIIIAVSLSVLGSHNCSIVEIPQN